MLENNFPQIWVPSPENGDLRQLLWHRHRLVQMRTRIMNQLQALAMNEGYRWKKKLFSEQGLQFMALHSLKGSVSGLRFSECLHPVGRSPRASRTSSRIRAGGHPPAILRMQAPCTCQDLGHAS